jgi:hypothetical protein
MKNGGVSSSKKMGSRSGGGIVAWRRLNGVWRRRRKKNENQLNIEA